MNDSLANETPRGRPFEPGQSGNPKGRPKGSRNAVTIMAEALLDGDAPAIMRKLVDKALDGDSAALRLCLERLLPPKRQRYVTFELEEEIKSPADAVRTSATVLLACANGEMSSEEATQILALIESHVRILNAVEVDARLAALERGVPR